MNIDIEINKETFKKPFTWAIIIPLTLLLCATLATAQMYKAKNIAVKHEGYYDETTETAERIVKLIKDAGIDGSINAQLEDFIPVNSGRACAKAANIHETRMAKESSSEPKKLKDGRFRHKQIFKFKSVRMIQIAKFIEHAEMNYTALTCKLISIIPVEINKDKDLWDASIDLEFISENTSE